MIEFAQQYAAELIAGLAVILSAVANMRVVRAERAAAKAQKATRGMDMLVEIERKNAAVGKLALVTAQKILLLQQNPTLFTNPGPELNRLRNNLAMLQALKDGEEEQRQVAEAAGGGEDVELHSYTLANVQRLRVHLEADIEKETSVYQEMLDKVQKASGNG